MFSWFLQSLLHPKDHCYQRLQKLYWYPKKRALTGLYGILASNGAIRQVWSVSIRTIWHTEAVHASSVQRYSRWWRGHRWKSNRWDNVLWLRLLNLIDFIQIMFTCLSFWKLVNRWSLTEVFFLIVHEQEPARPWAWSAPRCSGWLMTENPRCQPVHNTSPSPVEICS